MRIDSSGNLLVGTTDSDTGNAGSSTGIALGSVGYLTVARNGATSIYANRLSTDGEVISIRKDGTTVGSIGTTGGDMYLATGARGIHISDGANSIVPCNATGGDSDATTSLGLANARYTNLYLSGGVHLGGTASANKLDDYEEGTWTPTLKGSTTTGVTSLTVSSANYVKVGALVTVQCYLHNIDGDNTTAVGNLQIAGLPFVSEKFTPITLSHVNCFDFDEQTTSVGGYTNQGQTTVSLGRGSSTSLLSSANLSGTGKYLMFYATYKTTD
jgi:hypothetical protein